MTIKRLLTYLKPYKKSIYLVISIVILSSLCSIFIPKLTGNIISSIYESISTKSNINTKYLYTLIVVISLFYLISNLSSYIESKIMNNVAQKSLYKLRNEAYEKLSKLNMKYYDTHKQGEIMSYINNDIEVISSLFTQTIPKIISYSITFIGIIIVMLTINVTLTLITLIALPLTLIVSKLFMKLSKKQYKQYLNNYGLLNALIQESYTCKDIISLYNNNNQISSSFNISNKKLAKTNLKASLITTLVAPITSLINYTVYITIILLGSKYVLEKKLLLGDIQSLIQYTKQLSAPLNSISSMLTSIQASLEAAKRVFSLLDEKEEYHEGTLPINNIESIEFKNVNFSYNDYPLIENFNLKINKGEKIAIIGETGSGKTTIINLLMQFYKIKEGEILINNKSIYDYDLKSYYNNISFIPQTPWLFTDSIKNNLKFANFEAKDQDISNICNISSFQNFKELEENIIKEDSNNLSEGEKQLLIISRALLKENNLLILDEATSNIDSKNEKEIQDKIETLTKNKTIITIAHKISTITKADKIIVMKKGKIIEIGNHNSLYKEKGEYYSYLQNL